MIGTLLYYALSAPLVIAVNYFEDKFTGIPLLDEIYYRYYVHTQYIPLQQLAFYMIMLPLGFTFINLINLQNERKNVFLGRDGTYRDFKITIGLSVILFFFSGIVVLRQTFDLESYCHDAPADAEEKFPFVMAMRNLTEIDIKAPLHQLFVSIEKMNYLGSIATPKCYLY